MEQHFKKVKRLFKTTIQDILKEENNLLLDEAALPAYAHQNPFIDYIFWARLQKSYQYIRQELEEGEKILDFGCGTGVMTYALSSYYKVVGNDLEFAPLRSVQTKIQFSETVEFLEGDIYKQQLPKSSFDAILALDVLEHMSDEELRKYATYFGGLLNEKGFLIVSGPTENFLYKLGRRLAGQRFTGDYHESNIHRIVRILAEQGDTKRLARLVFPFTLFEIWIIRNLKK